MTCRILMWSQLGSRTPRGMRQSQSMGMRCLLSWTSGVISDKALDMLNEKELQSSSKRLCGPPLEVLGELRTTLVYKGRSSTQPVDSYREAQKKDPVCSEIMQESGWPKKHQLECPLVEYWRVRGEISLCDDLLLYDMLMVIPKAVQAEALRKIHQGHQGIQKCRQRVSAVVW